MCSMPKARRANPEPSPVKCSSALSERCPCVASSESLPPLRSAAGRFPAGLPWENSVSPLKSRCPRALVRRTSSVACRVGTWLWPWVAARSLREIADEGTWTLEDRKMVLIVLTKNQERCCKLWTSRLESEYAADPWVQDQIQRKLTLERFLKENPDFDFSGAEISGNHTNGGPDFSDLEK